MRHVTLSGEDDLLTPLAQAKSLKSFAFGSTQPQGWIGDPPLVPNLERLKLSGVLNETLAKWPVPPTLTRAELSLPITPEAAQAFSAAHPECEVAYLASTTVGAVYRGGEFAPWIGDGDTLPTRCAADFRSEVKR